jgi:hypothetical protein
MLPKMIARVQGASPRRKGEGMVKFEYDFSEEASRKYWKKARKQEKSEGPAESDDNSGRPQTRKAPYNEDRLRVEISYIYDKILVTPGA